MLNPKQLQTSFVPTLIEAFSGNREDEFLTYNEELFERRYPKDYRLRYRDWYNWYLNEKQLYQQGASRYNGVTITPVKVGTYH